MPVGVTGHRGQLSGVKVVHYNCTVGVDTMGMFFPVLRP